MIRKYLNIVILLLFTALISSCGDDPCVRGCDESGKNCQRECGPYSCVEADDWGYPKVWVPAAGDDPALNVKGQYPDQYVDAIDSKRVIIDAENVPLVMSIGKNDQWTSWFGGSFNSQDKQEAGTGLDYGRTVPGRECRYFLYNATSSPNPTFVDNITPEVMKGNAGLNCPEPHENPIMMASRDDTDNDGFYDEWKDEAGNTIDVDQFADCLTPCYLRYGMGLYIGFAANTEGSVRDKDISPTFHIPDIKRPDVPHSPNLGDHPEETVLENNLARGIDHYITAGENPKDIFPGVQTNDRLYFKIVDHFYSDNAGGYTVNIKQGTRSPDPGVIETVVNVVKEPIAMIMERLYKGITTDTRYVNLVRAILALYIVFYGFKFMIGGVDAAKKDVVMNILKMAIVVQVIAPNSWEFFYVHLFSGFTEGIEMIGGALMGVGDTGGGGGYTSAWFQMDQTLEKFFSAETAAKIQSTIFSNSLGFLFVIVLYFAIGLFFMAMVRAVVIFLVAYVGMSFLIAMFPLFIILILFAKTKELFTEWVDQLTVFSIQIIVLLAGLGMFSAIIMMYMEQTIGYNVCWNVIWDAPLNLFDMRHWMPDISGIKGPVWMDVNGDGLKGVNPLETAERYVDIPYLDPQYDVKRIMEMRAEKEFIDLTDIFLFAAVIFFMYNFMKFVPNMAEALKGEKGAADSANLFGAGNALYKSFKATATSATKGLMSAGKEVRFWNKQTGAGKAVSRGMKRGAIAGGSGLARGGRGIKNRIQRAVENDPRYIANRAKTANKKMMMAETRKHVNDGIKQGRTVSIDDRTKDIKMGDLNDNSRLSKDLGFGTDFGGGLLDMADKKNRALVEDRAEGKLKMLKRTADYEAKQKALAKGESVYVADKEGKKASDSIEKSARNIMHIVDLEHATSAGMDIKGNIIDDAAIASQKAYIVGAKEALEKGAAPEEVIKAAKDTADMAAARAAAKAMEAASKPKDSGPAGTSGPAGVAGKPMAERGSATPPIGSLDSPATSAPPQQSVADGLSDAQLRDAYNKASGSEKIALMEAAREKGVTIGDDPREPAPSVDDGSQGVSGAAGLAGLPGGGADNLATPQEPYNPAGSAGSQNSGVGKTRVADRSPDVVSGAVSGGVSVEPTNAPPADLGAQHTDSPAQEPVADRDSGVIPPAEQPVADNSQAERPIETDNLRAEQSTPDSRGVQEPTNEAASNITADRDVADNIPEQRSAEPAIEQPIITPQEAGAAAVTAAMEQSVSPAEAAKASKAAAEKAKAAMETTPETLGDIDALPEETAGANDKNTTKAENAAAEALRDEERKKHSEDRVQTEITEDRKRDAMDADRAAEQQRDETQAQQDALASLEKESSESSVAHAELDKMSKAAEKRAAKQKETEEQGRKDKTTEAEEKRRADQLANEAREAGAEQAQEQATVADKKSREQELTDRKAAENRLEERTKELSKKKAKELENQKTALSGQIKGLQADLKKAADKEAKAAIREQIKGLKAELQKLG